MLTASAQDQILLRQNIEADMSPSKDEMTTIWKMMTACPEYVNEDEWIAGKRLREKRDMEFLTYVAASRVKKRDTQHEYFHVLHGAYLLLNPIGGIFAMSRLKTRLAACAWLDDRIASAGATDGHENAAIFIHHDGPDNHVAFRLLYDTLKDYVFILPRHVISFDILGDLAERQYLGVFVRVQEHNKPQADEFCDKTAGKLNALCGSLVNPPEVFAEPDRPIGIYFGSGREEM
jgi:hypothetical protein